MKLLIGFLLMMSSLSFANDENENVAKLDLDLKIVDHCLTGNVCSISARFPSSINVGLELLSDNCPIDDDTTGMCPGSSKHYRGVWSQVRMLNGLRYFGIVTIHKFAYEDELTGEEIINYNILVEILNNDGVLAQMSFNTDSLKTLTSMNLMTPVISHLGNKYHAELHIGPPVNGNMDDDVISMPRKSDVNVTLGFLN